MQDETEQLNELDDLTTKSIEKYKYFFDKILSGELSQEDKDRYSNIVSRIPAFSIQYMKNKGASSEYIKNSINTAFISTEEGIKNS